jgi:class 3 adenylate cyclase
MRSEPFQQPLSMKVRVTLLGPFSITLGARVVRSWPRPPVKRLCELVLVSPGRRILRDVACEELFPNLNPRRARLALTRALSLARASLSELGDRAHAMLLADRTHIWVDRGLVEETDFEANTRALNDALDTEPGSQRDRLLALALATDGSLLEDEPLALWAERPRERLDWLRQEARLTLARDRAHGYGRSEQRFVTHAWEECLPHDPACEEASSALMHIYAAQGRQLVVEGTYKRCRNALEQLGLDVSPSFDEAHEAATKAARFGSCDTGTTVRSRPEERCLVTVLFAELAAPPKEDSHLRQEERDFRMREAFSAVMAEVEALGGTVTAVSGTGLVALFGAPEANEDDPERALLASFRAVVRANSAAGGISLRVGVETGTVLVGAIGKGSTTHYAAVGEAVANSAVLQSVARPASVLVGPTTRAAAAGFFDWGPSEEVFVAAGGRPIQASYLERPKLRPSHALVQDRLCNTVPEIGPELGLSVVREAVRAVTAGLGGVVAIAGEAGAGKTCLVGECRSMFTAWVRAAAGRLPLWLEGNAASYASKTSYGLYQRLLSAWVGVRPEEGRAIIRTALERAVKAAYGGAPREGQIDLLADVLEIEPGRRAWQGRPERSQRALFDAITSMVSRIVDHGPTVLVLEDLHWADPASLHLTRELFSLTNQGPLLMVLTRRPRPDDQATALETSLMATVGLKVRKLELSPLRGVQNLDRTRVLVGGIGDNVIGDVWVRADGSPPCPQTHVVA